LRVSRTARRQIAGAISNARNPALRKPRTKNKVDWITAILEAMAVVVATP
jgi:hypothetical protein